MLKAIKVRLYPTREQTHFLACQFGAARWVYNHMLDWRARSWKEDGKSISKNETIKRIAVLKQQEETSWLKQADSQALQQSAMHLDAAFQRFFRKQARFPRFKSKYGRQSISYPQRVRLVDDRALYLPKVGTVKAVLHRKVEGRIKTVTVSKSPAGKYYASILCEDGKPVPQAIKKIAEPQIMGVDMGLSELAITSESEKIANPRFLKRATANLRRKQKALSRKKKGSANRSKARALVAKAHERTQAARHDFQHKLSKRLIDENQAIVVETLKVQNMLKNRKLAKHIQDASWSALIDKLAYKAEWQGKHLVRIDQWFASSKTCSECGKLQETMALSVRTWTCSCGAVHDRDINAAINIKQQGIVQLKAEGLSVSACGGTHKSGSLPVAA